MNEPPEAEKSFIPGGPPVLKTRIIAGRPVVMTGKIKDGPIEFSGDMSLLVPRDPPETEETLP